MFAFGQASAPSVDALGKGPWRESAVNPGEEPLLAIEALLKDTRQEMNSLYIPKQGIDKKAGRALAKDLQPLERKARHGSLTTNDLERIEAMIVEMGSRETINPTLEERLLKRVNDMQQWHQYAMDRQGISAE
jgi:hypothetical protein